MKKLILIGRSESGKTSLTQALRGSPLSYRKTQYINYSDILIDTPGEYIQTKNLGAALAIYSYEADVVGLLCSATEPFSLFSPCIACLANREVIGIVTKIHEKNADTAMARRWLELCGCEKIFEVDSSDRTGIDDLISYLKNDG